MHHSINKKYEAVLNSKMWNLLLRYIVSGLAVNYTATTFTSKNQCCLATEFLLPQNENDIGDNRGRLSKSFTDLFKRSKMLKVNSLVNTKTPKRLLRATGVSFFKEGKHAATDLLK